ncbi:MAG: hypothetical protein H6742_00840 [Alphaproteobacteria bacterium]|nr:hypothetical protein [Alphaproteobacteria bacterium]
MTGPWTRISREGRGPHGELLRVERAGQAALAELVGDPEVAGLRAARTSGVRHPFLMRVDGVIPAEDLVEGVALQLEPHEGIALGALFGGGALPVGVAVDLFRKAARALHAAFDRVPGGASAAYGLVHGALSPDALRVDADGNLRLHGLGMAPPEGESGRRVFPERTADAWMAPELLSAEAAPDDASHAADVYALGVMFCQALTGQPALWASSDADWHDAAVGGAVGQVLEATEREDLGRLLQAMLAFDPATRPSAAEVEKELARIRRHTGRDVLGAWAGETVPGLRASQAERLDRDAGLQAELDAAGPVGEEDTAEVAPAPPLAEDDTAHRPAAAPQEDEAQEAEPEIASAADDVRPPALSGEADAAAAPDEPAPVPPSAAVADSVERRSQLWEIQPAASIVRAAAAPATDDENTDELEPAYARDEVPDSLSEDQSDLIALGTGRFALDPSTGQLAPVADGEDALLGVQRVEREDPTARTPPPRVPPAPGARRAPTPDTPWRPSGALAEPSRDSGMAGWYLSAVLGAALIAVILLWRPWAPPVSGPPAPGASATAASHPVGGAKATRKPDAAEDDDPGSAGGPEPAAAAPDAPGGQAAAPAAEPDPASAERTAASNDASPATASPAASPAAKPAAPSPSAAKPPAPRTEPEAAAPRPIPVRPPPSSLSPTPAEVAAREAAAREAAAREAAAREAAAREAAAQQAAAVAPAEPAGSGGAVKVSGDADQVLLIGSAGAVVPGPSVPPGTYAVRAVFSGVPVDAGNLTVQAGGSATIRCNAAFMRCSLR